MTNKELMEYIAEYMETLDDTPRENPILSAASTRTQFSVYMSLFIAWLEKEKGKRLWKY